jgi:predicted methyltransferase
MHIIDVFAAGGYYSELLARTVGPTGKVIAYNNPPYARFAGDKPAQRFGAGRLPNVESVMAEVTELSLPPNSLDAALFVLAYHDLYWRPAEGGWERTDPAVLLRTLHQALKPSGIVVVQDHAAAVGSEPRATADKLHRIDPERVKQDFAAAGFELEAQSDVFAHADDDLSKLVFDPAIRHRTQQFLFRFKKT